MPVLRGPHVVLHEFPKFRVPLDFRNRLPIDPEFFRRGLDAQDPESFERLGHALHSDLQVVKPLAGYVGCPEWTPFGVPVQFHSLAGAPVSEQDVLAFVVPTAVDFLEIEHPRVEFDRLLEIRDSDSNIADPEVGHGLSRKRIDARIHRDSPTAIDCAGKSRDRSYASCLTAKPPM